MVECRARGLRVRRGGQSLLDLVEAEGIVSEEPRAFSQELQCRGAVLVVAADRRPLPVAGLPGMRDLGDHGFAHVGGVAGDDERLGELVRDGVCFQFHAGSVIRGSMRTPATYLRSLDPVWPRQVWHGEAGGVVTSLGNGIVFPFIVIYLHNVRGISFAAAGLALSAGAVGALAAGFGAGTTVDGFGGRNPLRLGLVLQAASFALFPLIREAWHAFALLALEGAGTACFWPGQSTLLSRLTPAERTHSAFALQRISMNLGLGLGGVVGGLIASTSQPSSFTTLFLLDAATVLVFIGVLSTIREPRVDEAKAADRDALGYRAVFRDRNFVWLLGLNVLFVAVGYEVFALLPPFAKNYAGVSERWVGTMWLADTLLIVLIQLPGSKAPGGHRRVRALALMSLLFGAAALIVLGGGASFTGTAGALLL